MRSASVLIALGLVLGVAPAGAEDAPPAGPSLGVSASGPHHVYLVGDLLVTEPWVQADDAVPGQAMAYFSIENRGGAADRLVEASSPDADAVVVDANGASTPGLGDGGLELPPHKAMQLGRENVHLVFRGLHTALGEHRFLSGLLRFERAGPLMLDFATSQADAAPTLATGDEDKGATLTK